MVVVTDDTGSPHSGLRNDRLLSMPNDISFLDNARYFKEASADAGRVELLRWVAILKILLPAATAAAAAGNVTMLNALKQIWPLLPKSKTTPPSDIVKPT